MEGLASFNVKKEPIELYYFAIKKALSVNQVNGTREIASIKREIEISQQRIEAARILMLDNKIEATDFKETKAVFIP